MRQVLFIKIFIKFGMQLILALKWRVFVFGSAPCYALMI